MPRKVPGREPEIGLEKAELCFGGLIEYRKDRQAVLLMYDFIQVRGSAQAARLVPFQAMTAAPRSRAPATIIEKPVAPIHSH